MDSTFDSKVTKGPKRKGPSKGASDTVGTRFFQITTVMILGTWWRATRGSNPGPLVPETNALSSELQARYTIISNNFLEIKGK